MAAAGLAVCVPATGRSARVAPLHSVAKLDAAYEATLLGLPIGHVSWTIDVHDNRYSAAANGTTAGLLLIFSRGYGTAEAHGSVAGKEPLASNFLINITHGSASDEVKILFNRGKASESLAPPPKTKSAARAAHRGLPHGRGRSDDGADHSRARQREMAGPAACERTIAVFDGRMRYDLSSPSNGSSKVQVPDGYQGPAVVCAVYFHAIGRLRPEPLCLKYLQAERGMEIWLTPLSGTRLMVPFRLSVPTPIGAGILQATRFVWTRQTGRAGEFSAN